MSEVELVNDVMRACRCPYDGCIKTNCRLSDRVAALLKERDDAEQLRAEENRKVCSWRDKAESAEAQVEALREVLSEAIDTIALAERVPMIDPQYGQEVEELGRRIGFGALMTSASASWAMVNAERGLPKGGQFVAAPCHGSVVPLLKKMRKALETSR